MRGGEENKVFLLESFGTKPVKTEQMDKKHSVSLNLKPLCLCLHYLMIIPSQWPPLKFCSLFQLHPISSQLLVTVVSSENQLVIHLSGLVFLP